MIIALLFLLAVELFGYFAGSIPFGLLLGKLFGYGDIRSIGSGNIGATNALRTGNKWFATFTLLCDALKGFLPVYFINMVVSCDVLSCKPNTSIDNARLVMAAVCGVFAILGHVFPVWLKFKGGKGVATAIGTVFALAPLLGACLIGVWLITFLLSRISSLSALAAFGLATTVAVINAGLHYAVDYKTQCIYMLVVTPLIFITHKANISRLLKGEEHKWSKPSEPS